MDIREKPKKNKGLQRFYRIGLLLLALLILYTVTGFFIIPPVVKSIAGKRLSERLHRATTIGRIELNPFTLSCVVRGLLIKGSDGHAPFVSFDMLHVDAEIASLFKRAVIFKLCRLDNPYIKIVRNKDLSYNFSDLMEKGAEDDTPKSKVFFSFNNISISQGVIEFDDLPKGVTHRIDNINLSIPFLSNLAYAVKVHVEPKFEAVVNGTPCSFSGRTRPFDELQETLFDIDLNGLDIPYYLGYLPFERDFTVRGGTMDTKGLLSFIQEKGGLPCLGFSGTIILKDIDVADKSNGPLVDIPRIDIGVASSDFLRKKAHLSEIACRSPRVSVDLQKGGGVNLSVLLPKKEAGHESASNADAGEEEPFSVVIDRITFDDGACYFRDLTFTPSFHTTVYPISIYLSDFKTGKGHRMSYAITGETESGEGIKVEGDLGIDPVFTDGEATLRGLLLPKYLPYYKGILAAHLESGCLDLFGRYSFSPKENTSTHQSSTLKFSGCAATLTSFILLDRDKGEKLFDIPVVKITDAFVDLVRQEVGLGDCISKAGACLLKRRKDGTLSVQGILHGQQPGTPETGGAKAEKKAAPWGISMKKALFTDYSVRFEDLTLDEPQAIGVEVIKLALDDVSLMDPGAGKVALECRINKKGSASLQGAFGIKPLKASFDIDLRGIEVKPIQPYLTGKVDIILVDGTVTSHGKVVITEDKAKGVGLKFLGDASLDHFNSLDPLNAERLVAWDSVSLGAIDAGYNPNHIKVKTIDCKGVDAKLIVDPNGGLNLFSVLPREKEDHEGKGNEEKDVEEKGNEVKSDEGKSNKEKGDEANPEKAKGTEAFTIEVDTLSFAGGRIDVTDRSITPHYALHLQEIKGTVTGLSSIKTESGGVALDAKVEGESPLSISGKLSPFGENFYVSIKIDTKHIEMSPMTPYFGKYIGYKVQKGKLSLDLDYHIEGRELAAENSLFLDQFTLGDAVESPDAFKIPIKLAIALLKNRAGEIILDIPVRGSLDDPEFSMAGIVFRALLNLIAKAVTSPFALLQSLIGSGEDLRYIEFDYGESTITEKAQDKLAALAKALYERPSLKLDVTGSFEPEKDRDALRSAAFDRKIKAQKLKEAAKGGNTQVSLEGIVIEPEEYEEYLKRAYKAEDFKKPKNFIGLNKRIPPEEMERLIYEHIKISDDDLRLLALDRANQVKRFLVEAGKIDQEGVFVLEPSTKKDDRAGEDLPGNRVDMAIK